MYVQFTSCVYGERKKNIHQEKKEEALVYLWTKEYINPDISLFTAKRGVQVDYPTIQVQ